MRADLRHRRASNRLMRTDWMLLGLILAVGVASTACSGVRAGDSGNDSTSEVVEPPPLEVIDPSVASAALSSDSSAIDGGWAGFPVMPERPAPSISLTDQSGRPWALDDVRGKVVALFFGYTRCPDVCPQTLTRLQQAVALLGSTGDAVDVVLVSTDPEHDTPAVLASYLAEYNPRFVGLTGTHEAARAAADLFGAVPQAEQSVASEDLDAAVRTGSHEAVDPSLHSSRVWLVDASGQLRVSFVGAFTPADVAHDLALLLDERR